MKFPPIGGTMMGYGLPMPPPTPEIEQLYDPASVKHLPGKGPTGKGQFVNWGTKLYELELELSYKNNEIFVLKKKLKKVTDELYPSGNTNKKSLISSLQTQHEVTQKKIQNKERQLRFEQKRCRGLEHDLAEVKKENLKLRKRNLVNEKAVQTLPTNHEAVQVSNPKKPKTRSVMTQCTPTVLKITNSTRVVPRSDTKESKTSSAHRRVYRKNIEVDNSPHSSSTSFTSASPYASFTNTRTRLTPSPQQESVTVENKMRVEMVPEQLRHTKSPDQVSSVALAGEQIGEHFVPTKPGVKFATSMTIKENAESVEETKDPLEMSITQEFDKENSVKTVVHSNRDFEIKQKPMIVSNNGQMITGVEHVSRPEYLKPSNRSVDCDSGLGSSSPSDHDSSAFFRADPVTVFSPRTRGVSYKQILDGVTLSAQDTRNESTGRVYERNVHEYVQPDYHPPGHFSRPTSAKINPQFNKTAWEIYNRGSPKANPTGMLPFYLFKRSNESIARNRNQEKPVFVHVSEITMNR